jgi:hypothetical protein
MEHVTQREDGRVDLEKVLPKFDDIFTKLVDVPVTKPPTVIMYCPV